MSDLDWFCPGKYINPLVGEWSASQNNSVTCFIEYRDYYKAIAEEILKANAKEHFIYFADWQVDLQTWMQVQGGRKTFKELLETASSNGVEVRALLYKGSIVHDPVHNDAAATWISRLPTGYAFLDERYLIAGSHHQKMIVIKNASGVIGFCGGMDIADDRQARDGGPNPPIAGRKAAWHDVQARVEGTAAVALWQSFNARWRDLRDAARNPSGSKDVQVAPDSINLPAGPGNKWVQVIRTTGNGLKHQGLSGAGGGSLPSQYASSIYTFAPLGEMSIYRTLCQAIQNTTTTIYLEDQYLVESEQMGSNPAIPEVLAQTIAKESFKKMVILVPGAGSLQGELYQVWRRRIKFWKLLGPQAINKVKIYQYRDLPVSPETVHSKMWIFDDTFTVISSANCNRRSYSHDSEIGVGILDPTPATGQLSVSQELRTRLWLKHLNTKGPQRKLGDVLDFVAAASLWDTPNLAVELLDLEHPPNPPPDPDHYISGVELSKRHPEWSASLLSFEREWDNILDPDGS